jgi:hypothetical protein
LVTHVCVRFVVEDLVDWLRKNGVQKGVEDVLEWLRKNGPPSDEVDELVTSAGGANSSRLADQRRRLPMRSRRSWRMLWVGYARMSQICPNVMNQRSKAQEEWPPI